jgi:hypothetical protein
LLFQADDYSYAVLTFNDNYGYPQMSGTFVYMTKEGSVNFDIISCGKDCHVLIKFGSKDQDLSEPEEEEALAPRMSEKDMDPQVS